MAEAEDEEDEGFGDFTFAPYQQPSVSTTNYSSKPNGKGLISVAAATNNHNNEDESDETWGDFVNSSSSSSSCQIKINTPTVFSFSSAQSNNQSLPPASKHFDALNISSSAGFSNSWTSHTELTQQAVRDKREWINPKGPLPLSVFGEPEEEEEGYAAAEFLPQMSPGLQGCGPKPSSSVGISDSICNLYKQGSGSVSNSTYPGEQIKAETGWNSKSNESDLVSSVSNHIRQITIESASSLILENSSINALETVMAPVNQSGLPKVASGFSLDSNGFGANFSLSNLNPHQPDVKVTPSVSKFTPDFIWPNLNNEHMESTGTVDENGGFDDEGDADRWDFQVAASGNKHGDKNSEAEQKLRSDTRLPNHASPTFEFLASKSIEEQSSYISTWFKLISVCSQELEHGALVWKLSLQKNLHGQLLSDPRGKQFVRALGEIRRVVEVLRTSTQLSKPWILSSGDLKNIFSILEECCNLWASSGLKEALRSISNHTDFKYGVNSETIPKFINQIQNHDPSQKQPICRLSLLTPSLVPDMKMVVWDGEHYFLQLANLWANLICSDPPELPSVRLSS